MKVIILTTERAEGKGLKKLISRMNKDFKSVKNYTKEDILVNPTQFKDTSFIFSTWHMPNFTEEEIKKFLPSLNAVYYAAGTVKYFAIPFLNLGIRVFSAAKANAIPVAEFVTAQIILANKGYFQAQKEYKKPFWRISFNKARNCTLQKNGNYNTNIGLIGCGAIGSRVVKLLRPYKLNISVHDPFLSDEEALELGVRKTNLRDLFTNSDVISNHLPDTEQTKGILDLNLFSLMKDNVTFINTGRGEQVIEKDLIKSMRIRPYGCALLDVTKREPVWPWSRLLRMNNVFISPHIAGSFSFEKQRMVEYMLSAYYNTLEGMPDTCEIHIDQLSTQA